MARSRNIKPSFFTNDDLSELNPLARLLFIGMWTISDYKGCFEYKPKRLKVQILPYDDCDPEQLVNNLEQSGFISIYSVQGKRYIKILNFTKHQNPHKNEKESGSEIPDIDDHVVDQSKKSLDSHGLQGIENNREQDGTTPADSLNLIPDSLNLIPDTNTSPSPKSVSKAQLNTFEFDLKTVNTKLKLIACQPIDQNDLNKILVEFSLYYADKPLSNSQLLQKLLGWIRNIQTRPTQPSYINKASITQQEHDDWDQFLKGDQPQERDVSPKKYLELEGVGHA